MDGEEWNPNKTVNKKITTTIYSSYLERTVGLGYDELAGVS
jgi:hypothetical protein